MLLSVHETPNSKSVLCPETPEILLSGVPRTAESGHSKLDIGARVNSKAQIESFGNVP